MTFLEYIFTTAYIVSDDRFLMIYAYVIRMPIGSDQMNSTNMLRDCT